MLLVSFDPVADPTRLATFRATYNVPMTVPILGPYSGKLSDAGEALELLEPDTPQGPSDPDPGFVPYVQVERIKYSAAAPWPANAANTGLSLQRSAALGFGNEPLNWVAAAPSAGRANGADSDGDGMPNAWENEHELDPNSPDDAALDPDGDGVGSAALLAELCSGEPQRGQSARPSAVLTCGELIDTQLGPAARRGGYLFTVCLPLRGGGWSAKASAELDEEAAERRFIAYAWPDADGRFDEAFFLDQDENIQQLALPEGTSLSCDGAETLAGWKPWRGKRPRPGPLPGSAAERESAVR